MGGVAYTYVFIDGKRVEYSVAQAFQRMAAAFLRDTGCSLHIASGTRLSSEQIAIFKERYVLVGDVRGRRVYDTRWWQGKLWYRISPAGTVAQPGTSNHEEGGPNGPRSIDIYDSGSGAGVTVRGTVRDRWMERNAAQHGFENEGYNFREPWHKTFRGTIGGRPAPTPTPTPTPEPIPGTDPTLEELMALNSAVIAALSKGRSDVYDGTMIDFETGFATDWGQVAVSYNATMGRIFTEGGAVIVTRGHYDKLKVDFAKFVEGRKAHELEIARLQGAGK
ncbi:endolysin, L-Ala-D-Glu peptidase domain [Microbacterium phage Dewdrop]|nr:endolysin, L-Ala-D-Glu peptidase domain [Microbacterium phage Leaf]QGZ17451.1 endolysin, L-Ala-D-Glu peptidase domain [Microbacterium phage Dewdrop]